MSLSRIVAISCLVAVGPSMAFAGSLMSSQSTPHSGTVPAPHYALNQQTVASFATLSLHGDMSVRLAPAKAGQKPSVVVSLPADKGAKMPAITSSNGTLKIHSRTSWFHSGSVPQVTIYTPSLRTLQVFDAVSVSGTVPDTRGLKVESSGHAVVLLKGTLKPAEITEQGDSIVDMRWVDSPELVINNTDHSELRLAGRVHEMHARGSDQATLSLTYLRVDNAMVSVKNQAGADVTPLKALRGFANDQAHIYYYKTTPELTVWSRGSGTVLQLASHH